MSGTWPFSDSIGSQTSEIPLAWIIDRCGELRKARNGSTIHEQISLHYSYIADSVYAYGFRMFTRL